MITGLVYKLHINLIFFLFILSFTNFITPPQSFSLYFYFPIFVFNMKYIFKIRNIESQNVKCILFTFVLNLLFYYLAKIDNPLYVLCVYICFVYNNFWPRWVSLFVCCQPRAHCIDFNCFVIFKVENNTLLPT